MKRRRARHRVWLIHWNEGEAAARAVELTTAGYDVLRSAHWHSPAVSRLKNDPPDAVIVDLSRLPSQGRDVALAIRSYKSMLRVPLIMAGGEAEAFASIRRLISDARHTTWSRIDAVLRHAIANPPRSAVKQSVFAAYAATPLATKLGCKPNFVVATLNAPKGFEQSIGKLPQGARIKTRGNGARDLTLWFVKSRDQLARGLNKMVAFAAEGRLWIIWPRKQSDQPSDLSQVIVRQAGLAAGLVDFKISKINETWAGLRFTRRR
jgi:hypothetical protein